MTATSARKPAATGRILIWRGGSLWIGRGGEPADFHAHHAIQVSLPFPGSRLKLRLPDAEWKTYDAAIVAAQQRHEFDARGQMIAQLFVEPESRDGWALQMQYRNSGVATLPAGTFAAPLAALTDAYAARAGEAVLMSAAQATIAALSRAAPAAAPLDERIARAVELVRARLEGAVTLTAIAAAIHLSPERFRHLFIEQTGVRFRAYVLWARLERALAAQVAGASLTDAAHAGGFSDSAHLSRTFRKMFGITPASIHLE
jgi:AraC family transcriptional regulator